MKLSHFFQILGVSFFMGCFQFLPTQAQNPNTRTVSYTIKRGETAYRIAKEHGITVEQLLSLNPGMKAEHIQADMVINIPGKSGSLYNQGRMSSAQSSWSAQGGKPGQQQPQETITYKEYKVKRKDTAYSLAKANGITVDELMQANPHLQDGGYKLKKGTIIRIPIKKFEAAKPQVKGLDTIRVAIILPFIGKNDENIRSIEFYQGILLGLEELKKAKKNIFVYAFNEPGINENISSLMHKVIAKRPDVIVGPLYPSHFSEVASHAKENLKVASPFSSKVKQVNYNPNVFAFNTPATNRNDIEIELFTSSFKKDVTVVFLHKKNGDKKDFCSALQSQVIKDGYNIISLSAESSLEQIQREIANRSSKDFVIIPDDSNIETLKEQIALSEKLRGNLPKKNFSLLGFSPWIELSEGEHRKKFHEADIYILAPNYYFPYTKDAISFSNHYKHWFKSDLLDIYPRMAPLGYDFSIGFLGGLTNYGFDFALKTPKANSVQALPKLQNEMRFVKANSTGGYVNRSMWLVHFRKDMTITKTCAR